MIIFSRISISLYFVCRFWTAVRFLWRLKFCLVNFSYIFGFSKSCLILLSASCVLLCCITFIYNRCGLGKLEEYKFKYLCCYFKEMLYVIIMKRILKLSILIESLLTSRKYYYLLLIPLL
jgi:hypothetical protein